MLQELCTSAATRPQSPVAELQLITLPEVTQVLRTFNAWDLPYTELLNPEQQTIHGMFEHWAKHTPDAPSLTFGVGGPCPVPAFIRARHMSHACACPQSGAGPFQYGSARVCSNSLCGQVSRQPVLTAAMLKHKEGHFA